MTLRSSRHVAVIHFGGYDLRGDMLRLTYGMENLSEAQVPFGETEELHHKLGIRRFELAQDAYFDETAAGSYAAFVENLLGTESSGIVGLAGGTQGSRAWIYGGTLGTNVDHQTAAGALSRMSIRYQINGRQEPGMLVIPITTIATTGSDEMDTTETASSNGFYYSIQVEGLTLSTATSLTVSLNDSTTISGPWVEVATTGAISADGYYAFHGEVAGDIDRYLQLEWEFGGSPDGSTTANIVAAFARL